MPTDSPAAARPTRESVTALLDALVKALLAGRDAIEEFSQGRVPFDVLDAHVRAAGAARAALDAALASLCDDARYMAQLDEAYSAADFADEQFPGRVVLKFVLPGHTRVSSYLRDSLDSARSGLPRDGTEGSHA